MKTLLTLLSFAWMLTAPAWAADGPSYDDRAKINVQGEAVVRVKPDKILLRFGIETNNQDILAAKRANNEILQRAVAAFKECGVAEQQIQTDQLSIEPRWGYERQRVFLGYFVRNSIVVTLTDPERVEAVVTKALESGVNFIHGVDFQTTQFKQHREEARELALKAAREKAEKMAAVLGQSVGRPLQIQDNGPGGWMGYWSSWNFGGWGSGRDSGMSQNVLSNQGPSGEMVDNLALGQISIRAQVNVTFELAQ